MYSMEMCLSGTKAMYVASLISHVTLLEHHMTKIVIFQITVHLTRTVTILDTSTAEPRSSFWTNEARDLFEPVTFTFGSLADVERYWFQLQSTCLMTPIILSESIIGCYGVWKFLMCVLFRYQPTCMQCSCMKVVWRIIYIFSSLGAHYSNICTAAYMHV